MHGLVDDPDMALRLLAKLRAMTDESEKADVPPRKYKADREEAEPWPAGLDLDKVENSNIAHPLSQPKTKAVTVKPFDLDGQLWVATGGSYFPDGLNKYSILPLIPAKEFEERYIGYPTKFSPNLPENATDEQRLQFYTGVVVRVGKKEYAIAPAGDGRTISIVVPKEEE